MEAAVSRRVPSCQKVCFQRELTFICLSLNGLKWSIAAASFGADQWQLWRSAIPKGDRRKSTRYRRSAVLRPRLRTIECSQHINRIAVRVGGSFSCLVADLPSQTSFKVSSAMPSSPSCLVAEAGTGLAHARLSLCRRTAKDSVRNARQHPRTRQKLPSNA